MDKIQGTTAPEHSKDKLQILKYLPGDGKRMRVIVLKNGKPDVLSLEETRKNKWRSQYSRFFRKEGNYLIAVS